MLYVNESLCTGCGECVDVCPSGALRLADGVAQIEQSLCQECEACVSACPDQAILVAPESRRVEKPVVVRPALRASVAEPSTSRTGLWPAVGAALVFVGQEIVPRLAWALLDAWDRRQARSDIVSSPGVDVTGRMNDNPRSGGRRLRRRGGRR